MYSVLIVDDEKLTRDWLVRMIGWNGLGFSVAGCCGNGKEALEFLENSGADLIITDIKMPVCDGISMLEQIRRKGIRSPVLLLTGFGEFEYAMAAIQNGVSDYLLKPIEEEKLTAAVLKIRKQLDGRREESGSSAREQYYEIRERLDEMIRSGKAAGTVISLLERVWKNRTYRLYGLSFEHEEEKAGSCREALQKCIGTLKESCPVYELCTDGLILLAAGMRSRKNFWTR